MKTTVLKSIVFLMIAMGMASLSSCRNEHVIQEVEIPIPSGLKVIAENQTHPEYKKAEASDNAETNELFVNSGDMIEFLLVSPSNGYSTATLTFQDNSTVTLNSKDNAKSTWTVPSSANSTSSIAVTMTYISSDEKDERKKHAEFTLKYL